MSQKNLTDAQNRTLVKRAIEAARKSTDNDLDFARLVRATYATQHPGVGERTRGGAGTRSAADRSTAGGDDVSPMQSLYDDPRFAKNFKTLALRENESLRVIGGGIVKAAEFPDCVAVGNDEDWCCSGTLIARTVVVSAGHCRKSCATRVFFGSNINQKGTEIRAARVVLHPDYKKGGKHNDLMLMILEKPAPVKPRRIAKAAAIDKAKTGRVVGFGRVDPAGNIGYGIKRQVDVPIGSTGCSGAVNGKSDSDVYGCDLNHEIVAGQTDLAMDSCKGDSGGPFYIKGSGSSWLLAGATSRPTRGFKHMCGDGGIYVRVDQYREWIEKTAGIKLG